MINQNLFTYSPKLPTDKGVFTDSIHSPIGAPPPQSENPDISTVESKDWEGFNLIPCAYLKKDAPQPRSFQQYITYLSLQQNRLCNGCGTGLGKTLMSYLTFFYYKMKFPNTKLVVITTASAVMQYANEYHKFFYDSQWRPVVFYDGMTKDFKGSGTYAKARAMAQEGFRDPNGFNAMFMNYSVLLKEGTSLLETFIKLKKSGFNIFLILDEASHFKNLKSQTFNIVHNLSKMCDKVLSATATITNGRLEEIYAIMKGIGIQPFGNKAQFIKRYCITTMIPGQAFGFEIMGYRNIKEFVSLIKPYLVALRRKDVLEQLPSITSHINYVEHDKEQYSIISDLYNGKIGFIGKDILSNMLGGKLVDELTITNYIKTALQDPFILSPEHQRAPKGYRSPKTKEVIRILAEEVVSEKAIVYTPSKRYMYALREAFESSTTLPQWYRRPLLINGDIPMEERERIKTIFNTSDEHRVILINEAASEAINLQTAQAMIITSLPPTFGRLVQVVGRYNRIGTKHTALSLYYVLTKDSQDEDEYLISNQQGVLVASVTKEDYEGILDLDYINSRSKEEVSDLTAQDLQSASIANLVFKKRAKRKLFYRKASKKSNV